MAFLKNSLLLAAFFTLDGSTGYMTSRACVPDDRHCSTYQESPRFYCTQRWMRDNCRTLCNLPCRTGTEGMQEEEEGLSGYLGGEYCLTDCRYFKEEPCCGSNGITYRNICELFNAVCRGRKKFDFRSRGRCECEKPDHVLCKGYTNFESYYCRHPWMKKNCKFLCKICAPTRECHATIDMGFIFEPSHGFLISYEKYFVMELAATFGVTKHRSRAGLIKLDSETTHSIKLKDYGDIVHFSNAVDKITPIGKAIRIDKALKIAKDELFLTENGARMDRPKLVVLASSSYDTKDLDIGETVKLAEELRESGVIFIIIGTSPGTINSDIIRIAGGDSGNIFIARTFSELISNNFIKDILDGTCRKVFNFLETKMIRKINPV